LDGFLGRHERDLPRLNLGKTAFDFGAPTFVNFTFAAEAGKQMVCKERAFLGRQLERFSFKSG
jgi:hypothetical protein